MRFSSQHGYFELTPAKWVPGTVVTDDSELLLNVAAETHGFAAEDQVWVDRHGWADFLSSFRDLERTRRGAAELTGVIPGEFSVRFYIWDRAGHSALEGFIARPFEAGGQQRQLKLDFHLEFDPDQLVVGLREFESFHAAA